MQTVTIKGIVVITLAVCLAVGAVLIVAVMDRSHRANSELAASQAIENAERSFASVQFLRTERLEAILDALSRDEAMREAYMDGDRDRLYELASARFRPLCERHNIARWYFFRPESEGTVFLRVHDPEAFDDPVTHPAYRRAVETKQFASGFEVGRVALALRAVMPYRDEDGRLIGYLSLAEDVDDFLILIAQETGHEYAMFLDKAHMDRERWQKARALAGLPDDWDERPNSVLASSTFDNDEVLVDDIDIASVPEGGMLLERLSIGDSTYITGVFPVYEADGEKVAAVYMVRDITAYARASRVTQTRVVLSILSLVVLATMVILALLDRLVLRRLKSLTARLHETTLSLARGEKPPVYVTTSSNDEIGEFERFLGEFLASLDKIIQRGGQGRE
ncbi:MAG: hypothetical protein K0B85_05730 [Coriobacteriia bacterium]|nr:hypothetical protein [Coriobacteriia bacterium]